MSGMYAKQIGADLVQAATAQLKQSPIGAIKNIEVEVNGTGAVILTGRVGSYYYKQLAQETVTSVVSGDSEIINNIRVDRPTK